ncbi:hypothetical protein FN846DRAFT_897595 [Sphaerosporella brunnea]|uniref:Potassium channel tetramerisation-type BTB domain-containing protein n=1 Tax=Sphaerosporella brunnea TaxID=1250544 RepID=A0A5J5F551_9PEZI|nr:hypothetical protein FN846DRAFT_897595 [Sphaerosporella brunnea]
MSGNAVAKEVPSGIDPRVSRNSWFPDIPRILPHEKVFPIQIGSELFRLRAPSYFSHFFERQLATLDEGQQIRTLYIDRDPETFRDIARHLQGYHISPRDGPHFVRLFADAQFYSLPKLISQLFESEIFISIGSEHFQINRDLFNSPGNSPNYFTLGFAVFFSNPSEIFPGLSRDGLLRPPSILPPEVPNRSAKVFAELLNLLRGYPVQIRDEEHRQELLRDCKYFHFKGLEQKLIPHEISWNQARMKSEITIRLEDIRPSGVSFVPDYSSSEHPPLSSGGPTYSPGWINYARPFVDEQPRELIVEISGESTKLDWRHGRAEFTGVTNQRVSALLQVITNKLGLPISHEYPMGLKMISERIHGGATPGSAAAGGPASPGNTPLSEDRVKIRIGPECYLTLDGEELWDRDGLSVVDIDPLPPLDDGNAEHFNHPGSDAGRSAGGGGSSPGIQRPQPPPSRPTSATSIARPQSTNSAPSFTSQARKRLKRKASMDLEGPGSNNEWIMKRGQWRLRIQAAHGADRRPTGLEAILVGVKIEAFSGEYGRNSKRAFLV